MVRIGNLYQLRIIPAGLRGLKIPWAQARGGSIPPSRTTKSKVSQNFLFFPIYKNSSKISQSGGYKGNKTV